MDLTECHRVEIHGDPTRRLYVIRQGHDHEAIYNLSRFMRKPTFCICENKDADQLPGNREADLRFCFLYTDSTIP